MNAQRRRQKVAEHCREIERLLAYRRQLYDAMRVGASGCRGLWFWGCGGGCVGWWSLALAGVLWLAAQLFAASLAGEELPQLLCASLARS